MLGDNLHKETISLGKQLLQKFRENPMSRSALRFILKKVENLFSHLVF